MASVTTLTGSLLTGTTNFGPLTPAAGTTIIEVAVDRAGLTLLTKPISWSIELSVNSGSTWRSYGGATMQAGQLLDSLLVVQSESSFLVTLPSPADAATRIRGSVVTLEPLTTSVTVRTS